MEVFMKHKKKLNKLSIHKFTNSSTTELLSIRGDGYAACAVAASPSPAPSPPDGAVPPGSKRPPAGAVPPGSQTSSGVVGAASPTPR